MTRVTLTTPGTAIWPPGHNSKEANCRFTRACTHSCAANRSQLDVTPLQPKLTHCKTDANYAIITVAKSDVQFHRRSARTGDFNGRWHRKRDGSARRAV